MPLVSRGGAQLAYTRVGSGAPVLLIQGVGVIGDGWRPQREGLAHEFSLLTFDNRGIGASTLGEERLSIPAMAADALAILDAEGIASCHVTGHSMGGLIAQELALAAPARVRSLALLCTFARGRDALALRAETVWQWLRTRLGSRARRRRAFLELVMPPPVLARSDPDALAAQLAELFGRDLADQPPILMRQALATSRYAAGARLARLAAIPTLVASAAHDRIARPDHGRALAAAIPGARFVLLPDAGHGAPIQCAAEVNQLLRAHFTAAERGAPPAGVAPRSGPD